MFAIMGLGQVLGMFPRTLGVLLVCSNTTVVQLGEHGGGWLAYPGAVSGASFPYTTLVGLTSKLDWGLGRLWVSILVAPTPLSTPTLNL